MQPQKISRKKAKEQGLFLYYTGKPCSHGHISERYVSSFCCKTCSTNKARSERRKEYNQQKKAHNAEWRREYNARNRELVRTKVKERVYKDRQAFLEKRREYYALNKERLLQTSSKSREKHRLERRRRDREAYARDPVKRRAFGHNARAKRSKAEGFHKPADVKRIYQIQKGKCAYCKTRLGRSYHVDHIIPLARGGTNWPKNLQITCQPCNSRKSDRMPEKFARERGLLI